MMAYSKLLFALLAFCWNLMILAFPMPAQVLFYYSNNQRQPLSISTEKITVKFVRDMTDQEILAFQSSVSGIDATMQPKSLDRGFIVLGISRGTDLNDLLQRVKTHEEVLHANFAYLFDSKMELFVSNRITVEFHFPPGAQQLEELKKRYDIEIDSNNSAIPTVYNFQLRPIAPYDVLETANRLYEEPSTLWSLPEMWVPIQAEYTVLDSHWGNQYYLRNTGQNGGTAGIDINVLKAWDISLGSNVDTVAVIDPEGVISHVDLPASRMVTGWNAFLGNSSNTGPNGSYVTFPGTVSGVFVVSAIDKNGSIHLYSPHSPLIDVVAPSGLTFTDDYQLQGDVWTIDISGTAGYNDAWPLLEGGGLPPHPADKNYTAHFGGTSAAAPQASGVAALILSLNPSFTGSQIKDIMRQSATDMGATGDDEDFGYGRLNAYQALLLAHAFSNKSMSVTATATNSGRRMVKTSDGRYHLVFESGIVSGGSVLNEVYYRRSNVGGTSWETPVRLSNGSEQNRFPSIAEHTGKLYVVWQRKTGTNTYDIHLRHFTGSPLENNIITISAGVASGYDPIPVIAISTPAASFEMLVAYRTSSGLKSKRSTSTAGSTWENEVQITSSTSARNPSLVYYANNYANFEVSWDNGNGVYYRHFYGSNWSFEVDVSYNAPALLRESSSFALTTANNRHIAWQATDPSQGYRKVIFHNFNLNPTIFSKFYSTTVHYYKPSLSAIASGGAMMFWHDESAAKNVRYSEHNGSYWESTTAGIVYVINGADASGAIANPPNSPIKAVYRSAGSSPYTLALGTALQKTNAADTIVYSRQLVYAVDTTSVLTLRLFAPQITGENSALPFPEVSEKDSLQATSLAEKLTFDFMVPATAQELKLDTEVYADKADRLLPGGSTFLLMGFELINTMNQSRVAFKLVDSIAANNEIKSTKSFSLPLAAFRGATLRLRPVLSGLDFSKVRGSLVHEYGAYEPGSQVSRPSFMPITNKTGDLLLQAYPNPFNPSTQIHFTMPVAGVVSLRVFDNNGRVVRRWHDEPYNAGKHVMIWDGRDQAGQFTASGVYFAELVWGKERRVAKMTLVR